MWQTLKNAGGTGGGVCLNEPFLKFTELKNAFFSCIQMFDTLRKQKLKKVKNKKSPLSPKDLPQIHG